jgi:hypothetical protein
MVGAISDTMYIADPALVIVVIHRDRLKTTSQFLIHSFLSPAFVDLLVVSVWSWPAKPLPTLSRIAVRGRFWNSHVLQSICLYGIVIEPWTIT